MQKVNNIFGIHHNETLEFAHLKEGATEGDSIGFYNIKSKDPDWPWAGTKGKLLYRYNSLGHRNDEELEDISSTPNWFLSVGCSMVAGDGVFSHQVFHSYVGIGLKLYNGGVGGAANDMISHNAIELLRQAINPPRFVLFNLTHATRQTIIETIFDYNDRDSFYHSVGSWTKDEKEKNFIAAANTIHQEDIRTASAIHSLSAVCEARNIPLLIIASNFTTTHIEDAYWAPNALDLFLPDCITTPISNFVCTQETDAKRNYVAERSWVSPTEHKGTFFMYIDDNDLAIDDVRNARDSNHPGVLYNKLKGKMINNTLKEIL